MASGSKGNAFTPYRDGWYLCYYNYNGNPYGGPNGTSFTLKESTTFKASWVGATPNYTYGAGTTITIYGIAYSYDGSQSHPIYVGVPAGGVWMSRDALESNAAVKSHTITLNKNGGTGGSNSVTINEGTAQGSYPDITLPTKTGYSFNGYWSATSGGTQYYNKDGNSVRNFDLTSDATWYAQWIANTYTVTYNKGDATSGTAPSAQTKTYDVSLTLQTNSGNLAHSNTSGSDSKTDQKITLSYNLNGGTSAAIANTTGTAITISGTHPITWTANGWSTTSGATTKKYSFGGTYTDNAAITLYPSWTKTNGTVTYTATSASATITSTTPTRTGFKVTYNANSGSVSSTSNTSTYAFNGWTTKSDGSGTVYAKGATYKENITASKTVTLYAKWTHTPLTLLIPEKEGYYSTGWYTSATGGTLVARGGESYTPTAAITLYSHWAPESYTITFNAGENSSIAQKTKTVTYDSTYGNLPIPLKVGYVFEGWYIGDQKITEDSKVTITSNTTLTANWVEDDGKNNGNTSLIYRWNASKGKWEQGKLYRWSILDKKWQG